MLEAVVFLVGYGLFWALVYWASEIRDELRAIRKELEKDNDA